MMGPKTELRIPKKLRRDGGVWLPRTLKEMEIVGQTAIDMIRNRVLTKGVDGTGKKFPKLVDKGWFWTSGNDNRFGKHVHRTKWRPDEFTRGQPTVKPLKKDILVHNEGYASLKQRMTGKRTPRKNGYLTGDMWRGFQQLLKKSGDGWYIKLVFNGGSRIGKVAGWGNKTIKVIEDGKVVTKKIKVPKMKTQTLKNRDKARGIQLRGNSPVMALLSLTPQENDALMQMFMSLVKPFGDKVRGEISKFRIETKIFRKSP